MGFKARGATSEAVMMCEQAIAYLKPAMTGRSPGGAMELGAAAPVVRDLGNGLVELYAVDRGDRFELVQEQHARVAGVDRETLHARGIANLTSYLGELRVVPYGAVYAVLDGGGLEASLILLDDFWDQTVADLVSSSFAVAVPARDVIAFCDAASAAGMQELRAVVARLWVAGDVEKGTLVSDRLFTRRDRAWAPLS